MILCFIKAKFCANYMTVNDINFKHATCYKSELKKIKLQIASISIATLPHRVNNNKPKNNVFIIHKPKEKSSCHEWCHSQSF